MQDKQEDFAMKCYDEFHNPIQKAQCNDIHEYVIMKHHQ